MSKMVEKQVMADSSIEFLKTEANAFEQLRTCALLSSTAIYRRYVAKSDSSAGAGRGGKP